MDTLQMPTRAPAISRGFSALSGFFDSAWQVTTGHWLGRLGGDARRLDKLRGFVLAALEACVGAEAERLRRRVRHVATLARLVMLREALFNGIARAQCQATAGRFLARFDQLAGRHLTRRPARAR